MSTVRPISSSGPAIHRSPIARSWRSRRPALLPCNVVLREDGPDTIVEALDPVAVLGIADAPGVRAVAEEAKARLERSIGALEARS
jgi:5,10-methenyltetrahydromethanopterin hydrogenase